MAPRFLVPLFVILLVSPARAQEEPLPEAEVVQSQLEKWVETKQLISRERSGWQAEKAMLSDLNSIRRKEIAQLEEFITAAGERVAEIDRRRAEFIDEEKELKEWRKTLETKVDELEETIRPLLPRLPAPLREKVAESVNRLQSPDPSAPLQNRARDLLLVLQATLEFHSTLTLDGDIREIDGERREIDVLYLGLTQAWYADATGRYGGFGIATDNGWNWVEENRLARRIRKAIEIQQRTLPPEFVELPVLNGKESGQ